MKPALVMTTTPPLGDPVLHTKSLISQRATVSETKEARLARPDAATSLFRR